VGVVALLLDLLLRCARLASGLLSGKLHGSQLTSGHRPPEKPAGCDTTPRCETAITRNTAWYVPPQANLKAGAALINL
jgi:hypothetical protein